MARVLLGDNASGLVSGMTAATIGGSPNFLAVAQVTGILTDPRLAAIGGAALLTAVLYMVLLAILPEIKPLRRLYPIHHAASDEDATIAATPKLSDITWGPLLAAVVSAAILGGVSIAATQAIGQPQWALLLVTALALVLAWLGHDRLIQVRAVAVGAHCTRRPFSSVIALSVSSSSALSRLPRRG